LFQRGGDRVPADARQHPAERRRDLQAIGRIDVVDPTFDRATADVQKSSRGGQNLIWGDEVRGALQACLIGGPSLPARSFASGVSRNSLVMSRFGALCQFRWRYPGKSPAARLARPRVR
jgi:hypothetical protein